jgi:peptide/nickel transport system permease protein
MQRSRIWRRYRKNPLAVCGAVVIIILMLFSVFSPMVLPYGPTTIDLAKTFQPPGSSPHLLGTDDLGRDMVARLAYGAHIADAGARGGVR